jgi:hypothetical protein
MIDIVNFFIQKVFNGLTFSIIINLGIIPEFIQNHDILVQIRNA